MADALKTFREGEDILASETNDNNQYLLSKLSDNAAQVQQYVEGEVATIKSNVASVQATLQNNIDESITELDAKKPIYVVERGATDNGGYCKWSDGFKEEWGNVQGYEVLVTFKNAFSDTNYYICWQFIDNYSSANADFNKITVNNKTTTSALIRMNSGGTYKCCWYACGF